MSHQNEVSEFFYQPFPNLKGIPEKEFDKGYKFLIIFLKKILRKSKTRI